MMMVGRKRLQHVSEPVAWLLEVADVEWHERLEQHRMGSNSKLGMGNSKMLDSNSNDPWVEQHFQMMPRLLRE